MHKSLKSFEFLLLTQRCFFWEGFLCRIDTSDIATNKKAQVIRHVFAYISFLFLFEIPSQLSQVQYTQYSFYQKKGFFLKLENHQGNLTQNTGDVCKGSNRVFEKT